MSIFKHKIFFGVGILCLFSVLSNAARAQDMSFRYNYKLDLADANEAPQVSGVPEFDYPEAARKNGVEGTLKLTLTLGEDGKVKNIAVEQGLPFGVTEAVTKGLERLKFQPATRNGQTIAVKMIFYYVVSLVYTKTIKMSANRKLSKSRARFIRQVKKPKVAKIKFWCK